MRKYVLMWGNAMQYLKSYSDERDMGTKGLVEDYCAYCGGPRETFDHVPPKFFLDDPLPENLHKIGACLSCNNGASPHEQYVACLIDAVLAGSTSERAKLRPKVAAIFECRPALAEQLERLRQEGESGPVWAPDMQRAQLVGAKLARGHAAFELSLPLVGNPDRVFVIPLMSLPNSERQAFETYPATNMWPEVGSRAIQRMVVGGADVEDGWVIVQQGRYRYMAVFDGDVLVRVVLSEYLGIEVSWASGQDDWW